MKPFPKKYDRKAAETRLHAQWAGSRDFTWDPALDPQDDYVIDTPPPTVSGTLHVGHLYSYTQADIIARYMRMSGRNVLYPVGWDDNGLPTERLVEKVRKVRGGMMERDRFTALCREVIPEYESRFRHLFTRLGLSVDWSREYRTISDASRSVSQLSFIDLYRNGYLERRREPSLWDPVDRTAVAQAEVDEMERESTLNEIPFRLENGQEITVATTRPELLGACGALMIHPGDPRTPALRGQKAVSPLYGVPVPVIADPDADPEKGTGVVMCCTFGDVTDIHWWRTHKLPLRTVIDNRGRLESTTGIGQAGWPSIDTDMARKTVAALAGMKVAAARKAVLEMLDAHGLLKASRTVRQTVPVAERSRAPLEIIVTPQWFIRTLDFRDEILARGNEIEWYPPFMKQRFDSWVEGLQWDWLVSRQRHFGVPLPVWYSKRPGEEGRVIIPDERDLPVDPVTDVPRGYEAHEVAGERDVLDTWATSSVTPQLLTGAVNDTTGPGRELHRRLFPVAMRPQAHEIIRTWAFYTIVKSLHHQNSVPWKRICVSGWCLARDGSKMSKSKGNAADPLHLLDEYGADAVRYWTGTSRLGHDTTLTPATLKQGKRLVTKLWNASRLAHGAVTAHPVSPATPRQDLESGLIVHPLDRWLLGRLASTVQQAGAAFEAYEYAHALRITEEFFRHVYCDNYLEFVKNRIQFTNMPSPEEVSAVRTLYHAATVLLRLFAPYMPYVCDTLNDLFEGTHDRPAPSVHGRGRWPRTDEQVPGEPDAQTGSMAVDIIAAVRRIKTGLGISLRAPAGTLTVDPPAENRQQVAELLEPVSGDIRATAAAGTLTVGTIPKNRPSATLRDGRTRVAISCENRRNPS